MAPTRARRLQLELLLEGAPRWATPATDRPYAVVLLVGHRLRLFGRYRWHAEARLVVRRLLAHGMPATVRRVSEKESA